MKSGLLIFLLFFSVTSIADWIFYATGDDDEVDIYDFAGEKPMIVDFSTVWCPPCNGLSSWLSGKGDTSGFGNQWPNIKTHIDNGDLRWVTVLAQDAQGQAVQA